MTLKIKRTGASDYGQFIKALFCGEPGSGKTLISSTFPNPFYASAEGGLMSIADRGIPYVDIRHSDELVQVRAVLAQEDPATREKLLGFPVDTVVVDTIDEVQNLLIRERLDSEHKVAMQLQDWGWLGEQMKALIRGFRNLPMNVVFTCHLKEVNDGDSGSVSYKPMLSGQMGDAIPGYVDLALVLKSYQQTTVNAETNSTETSQVRELLTVPNRHYPFIKDRSGKLDETVEVNFNDDYERIHSAIFDNVEMADTEEYTVDLPADVAPPPPAKKVKKAPAKKAPAKSKKAPAKAPAKKPASSAIKEAQVVTEGDGLIKVYDEDVDGKTLKRYTYRVGDQEIYVRNKLPDGVLPKKVDGGQDIFCVDCGGEMDEEQADLSRIKFRMLYDRDCFEKHSR